MITPHIRLYSSPTSDMFRYSKVKVKAGHFVLVYLNLSPILTIAVCFGELRFIVYPLFHYMLLFNRYSAMR